MVPWVWENRGYWLTCDEKEQAQRIRGRRGEDLDWELKRFVELRRIQAKAAQEGFIGKEVDSTGLTTAEVAGKIWRDICQGTEKR